MTHPRSRTSRPDKEDRKRRLQSYSPDDITDEILRRIDFDTLLSAERAARTTKVARINGVAPARIEEAPKVKAATWLNCSECKWPDLCRASLARDPPPEETEFCPNARIYRAFAALDPIGPLQDPRPAEPAGEAEPVRRPAPASADESP